MFTPFTSLMGNPVFHVFGQIYDIFAWTAFVWGPTLLVWLAQHLWLEYRQMLFIKKNYEFVMLEIKLPKIIDKTPVAMELVLQAFHQTKTGNWWERWWDGFVKPWFSLEICSFEGSVKFFIRTPAKFKKGIEAHLYAQYPDIEVHEVPDYVSVAPYLHEKDEWKMHGCHFVLTKADPYPIKTYVNYGLDSYLVKEEQKSDPLTSMIEVLGSIGRGQYMWFQVIIQATGERFKTPGTWLAHHDWKEEGKNLIKELQEKYGGESGSKMTKRQGEIISAIENSMSKPGFDCGFRALYLARREQFDGSAIGGMLGAYRAFSSQDLNGIKPVNIGVDYPWEDYNDMRLNHQKKEIYDAFVRRSYFHSPHKKKPYVLNTEELATIFHFPGGVAETPTFTRIESRKGEPPANLPI